MNRRIFLISSISFLLTQSAWGKNVSSKTLDVYIDESGKKGSVTPFVFGALVVDSTYSYKRLDEIRTASKFRQVLHYNSSNHYKKLLAMPYLHEFFSNDKMYFTSIVFPPRINKEWPSNRAQRASLYHHNYSDFMKKINSRGVKLNVFLEHRSTTGEDSSLKEFLEQNNSQIKVQFIREKESNCIQLSDLLTGSIFGDLSGVKDKTKVEIISDIRRKLRVRSLASPINFNRGKFNVKIAEQI
jgi:hypothetical protein